MEEHSRPSHWRIVECDATIVFCEVSVVCCRSLTRFVAPSKYSSVRVTQRSCLQRFGKYVFHRVTKGVALMCRRVKTANGSRALANGSIAVSRGQLHAHRHSSPAKSNKSNIHRCPRLATFAIILGTPGRKDSEKFWSCASLMDQDQSSKRRLAREVCSLYAL
jgi:hypothetical protein